MISREEFECNQRYYMAFQYLLRLLEMELITIKQFRRANKYFRELFGATIILFR